MAKSHWDEMVLIDKKNWWSSPVIVLSLIVGIIVGVAGVSVYLFLQGDQYERVVTTQGLYDQASNPEQKFVVVKANLDFPVSVDWLMELGSTFYIQKKYDLSVEAYQLVIQKHPDSTLFPGALLGEAEALIAVGKGSDAVPLMNRLLHIKEQNAYQPLAHIVLARWQISQKQTKEARQTLEDLQAQFPDSPFSQETSELLSSLP